MGFECTTSKIFHPFLLILLLDVLFLVQLKNSAQFKLYALPLSFVLMRSCLLFNVIIVFLHNSCGFMPIVFSESLIDPGALD